MKTEEKKYCYRYPHPALTADCVIYGFDGSSLKVLLIERGLEPYKGMWALPGGFMRMDETIEQAASRELQEETGLSNVYLEQFRVFSAPGRDPRERVVTVAFIALVRPQDYQLLAGDDAADARWFDTEFLPPMAFDHAQILAAARQYLMELIKVKPIAFQLLDTLFSLPELQKVYESILGREYDRRNFQRKAMQSGIIAETDETADTSMADASTESLRVDQPARAYKPQRGRKSKFFKLLLGQLENNDDDTDASIKDLFNFKP